MSKRELPLDANGRERRWVSTIPERRGDEESLSFHGHAAVTNVETLIGSRSWGFIEMVEAGAFLGAIDRSDCRALQNHDANFVLGRQSSGTLVLAEDDEGLVSDCDMAPTTYAKDLAILMGRRDVTQMSFAFTIRSDEWSVVTRTAPDGTTYKIDHRRITEIEELYDISPVTYPAYVTTDVALASAIRSEDPRALGELFARYGIKPSEDIDEGQLVTDPGVINAHLARHYQNKHNANDRRRSL